MEFNFYGATVGGTTISMFDTPKAGEVAKAKEYAESSRVGDATRSLVTNQGGRRLVKDLGKCYRAAVKVLNLSTRNATKPVGSNPTRATQLTNGI